MYYTWSLLVGVVWWGWLPGVRNSVVEVEASPYLSHKHWLRTTNILHNAKTWVCWRSSLTTPACWEIVRSGHKILWSSIIEKIRHRHLSPSGTGNTWYLPYSSRNRWMDYLDKPVCPIRPLRYDITATSNLIIQRKRLFILCKHSSEKDITKVTVAGWLKTTIQTAIA